MVPTLENCSCDTRDLPPDLADMWCNHYGRIFPTMFDRERIYPNLKTASTVFPDLFKGVRWLPSALASLDQAVARRAAVEIATETKQAAKRNTKRKAQRQAHKRNRH